MAKTEIILTHNIVGLGAESDQVKVASGYARNYLFPKGLAIPLTGANKRRIEALRRRRAEREAHEFNTMSELARSISKLTAVLVVKTGDDGKMFGSVTAGAIADQLHTQFDIALDKKKIHLPAPIRTTGEHEVELRLHHDVPCTLKVRVESSTPPPETASKTAADAAKDRDKGKDREKAKDDPRGPRKAKAPEGKPPEAAKPKPSRG